MVPKRTLWETDHEGPVIVIECHDSTKEVTGRKDRKGLPGTHRQNITKK